MKGAEAEPGGIIPTGERNQEQKKRDCLCETEVGDGYPQECMAGRMRQTLGIIRGCHYQGSLCACSIPRLLPQR